MEMEEILRELWKSKRDGNLQIFRKLITCGPLQSGQLDATTPTEQVLWQPVLMSLLEILINNREYSKELTLLIPHAFTVLLHNQYEIDEFKIILQSYLQLETNHLRSFDTVYNINDLDLFKLQIIHGYLQVNRNELYIGRLCELSFEILYQNAIRYTKHTYFAYKVLQMWLKRTSKTDFWENNDPCLEKKLASLIYSNWNNSIKEVSKQNSTTIFNQYLRIMNKKYEGFLQSTFKDCLNNISWLNETKYEILTEICDIWENVEEISKRDFIICMFKSLENNRLRNSGIKLYNTISNKLSDEQWKDIFGYPIKYLILQWGYGPQKNYDAFQLLCTQCLEPTIIKRRSILLFLWKVNSDVPDILFRSHLERIASHTGVLLQGNGAIQSFINHSDEYLRLNNFATHCQKNICFKNDDLENNFEIVKHFLFYNANSSSTFLRRGIIKYFKIFFLNLLKSCNMQQYYTKSIFKIFYWLHEFLLDCFEIGSCYQRKALGIKLYEMFLFYTDERKIISNELKTSHRYREDFINGFKMKQQLRDFGEWMFTNKISLFWLLKLTLDSATDIREISAGIIIEHFQKSSLNDSEKKVLLNTAITKCNSSKFYETESGSLLIKILSNWLPFNEIIPINEKESLSEDSCRFYKSLSVHKTYIDYMLTEAGNQLAYIKKDILRAAAQNSPFHGTLTTILNVGFRNELNTESITSEFAENLLNLLEDAVNFFLMLLSSKSSNSEFSSSFAEMGLAIDKTVKDSEICDEYDDVILSPAHQVVITCIWISLKVSCELASEIGMLTYSYEMVERSANVITLVLMKCRHKGAIEAAGVAIGCLTRKLVNMKKYSNLPEIWLNNLTSGSKVNPNLTRRSAGLSIMFHRIVANDNRHGKPLVHIAIRNLLASLENTEDESRFEEGENLVHSVKDKNEFYQDLPHVKYLHFIQRLVADSDLHAQVVPYLEKITMRCFKELESQIWTIRNASLQLFGAIVPRITGQPDGDQTLDFGNGYSIDHFITHYSELANHIFLELTIAASWNNCLDATLKSHSAIVPSLILLSRMSTGGSDLIDYSSKTYISNIKQNLLLLFGSPIGNVRSLAAKAYAVLVAFPQITSECDNLKQTLQEVENPNYAHGYFCAIKYLSQKFQIESKNINPCYNTEPDIICNQKKNFQQSYSKTNVTDNSKQSTSSVVRVNKFWNNLYHTKVESNLCYVIETMSLLVIEDPKNLPNIFLFKEIGEEVDAVLNAERSKPGFSEFVDTIACLYADYINYTYNIDKKIIQRILNSQCTDQSVAFVNHLKYDVPVQDIVLDYILQVFPDCEEALLDAIIRYLNESIKKSPIFLTSKLNTESEISQQCFPQSIASKPNIKGKLQRLLQKIREDQKYWKMQQFLYILINCLDFDSQSFNEMVDYCYSNALDDDEIVRKSAVECLSCLLLNFKKTENVFKLKILKTCLVMLKDEVLEIRELVKSSFVHFFGINSAEYTLSPFSDILYFNIFHEIISSKNTDNAPFSAIEIAQFFILWVTSINCIKDLKTLVESPFDHEDDATSAEETKLLNVIFSSISHLNNNVLQNNLRLIDNTIDKVILAKQEFQNKADIDFCDLKTILDLSYINYMVTKKEIVLKLCNLILESAKK